MAALSAAWRLSGDQRVGEITIYQRGWRLGGKGASSRGANGRIEEHGLHVWLGYYDNAFRVMRECYEALDREVTAPQCPIRTWREAFAPSTAVGLAARLGEGWEDWTALFSPNDEVPGEPEIDTEPMSPARFVLRAQQLVRDFVLSLDAIDTDRSSGRIVLSADPVPPRCADALSLIVRRALDAAAAIALEATRGASAGLGSLPGSRSAPFTDAVRGAVSLLDAVGTRLAAMVSSRPGSRRIFDLVDLVVTNVRGILADGLLVDPRGFGAINGEEYRDWLLRHGAARDTFDSPLLGGVYDLVFGYRNGDPELPRFAAGTALYLSAKIFFEFKGSIFWKMQAGMGDVAIAPMYEALHARGVRFAFFHDVRGLVLSPDGTAVDVVHLARQVDLAEGNDEYEPLVDVGGLPCFPSSPRRELVRGEVIDPQQLETLWCRDRSVGDVDLLRGRDFDEVIYALSVGMVPHTCAELLARDQRWQRMTRHVGTVATQSLQLWMRSSDEELGWAHPGSTITGYVKPFDTIASMSHLLDREQWPQSERPRSVFYFCNTLPEDAPPGPEAVTYRDEQRARVRGHAERFLEESAAALLPGSSREGRFDWDELVGACGSSGAARLESQHWTANVDPSDRYVQSLPGTDRYRLRPDDSGFDHLVLAGDWTDCGLNAGCIEAAVVSGLQAANAVLGEDRWARISGAWSSLVGT